jgi:hypothetical protein
MTAGEKLFRACCVPFAGMFAVAAYVQLNDPDPVQWVTIYGLGVVASVLALAGRRPWPMAGVLCLVVLVWAVALLPGVFSHPANLEGLTTWHMIDTSVEEEREMTGLLLLAGWLAVIAVVSFRAERRDAGHCMSASR